MGIWTQEESDCRDTEVFLMQEVPSAVDWRRIVISVNVCVCQMGILQPLFYPPLSLILHPKVVLADPTLCTVLKSYDLKE